MRKHLTTILMTVALVAVALPPLLASAQDERCRLESVSAGGDPVTEKKDSSWTEWNPERPL